MIHVVTVILLFAGFGLVGVVAWRAIGRVKAGPGRVLLKLAYLLIGGFWAVVVAHHSAQLLAGGKAHRFDEATGRYYVKEKGVETEASPVLFYIVKATDRLIDVLGAAPMAGFGCLVVGVLFTRAGSQVVGAESSEP